MAKAWPKILEEVPDAELFVIGSGKLYDKKSKLGKWGLADERYESTFMKYLTRGEDLLPGVHLLGTLGGEKYAVLAQTKVGVPNPSGHTETFCISAVEMQMMGARVVSKRCAGYLDTVRNGVLFVKLASSVVKNAVLMEKEGIIQALNKRVGEDVVKDIIVS